MKRHPILKVLIRLAAFAVVIWAVLTFVAGIRVVHTNEMYPSVRDGQLIVFFRLSQPGYESVVLYEADGNEHLGRVMAQPGDEVTVTAEQGLSVNGSMIFQNLPYKCDPGPCPYPCRLGEDEFFIMVDNRETVSDSRSYGAVSGDDVKGVVIFSLQYRGF